MRADKAGLILVMASLAAIAVVVGIVFQKQHDSRLDSVRTQGVSLARTMSAIPFQHLLSGGAQQGVMQVLKQRTSSGDIAYVSLTDVDGNTVSEVSADGVIVPTDTVPAEPSAWLGERRLLLRASNRDVVEFHAPLLDYSELRGFVRIGFFYPGYGPTIDQIPFLASMALTVFLLVPLFYFLIRMEIRPLRTANLEISRMLEGQDFRRLEVVASGELGQFMRRFNKFAEHAQLKIENLEAEQRHLITSSKLLDYKKSRVETALETVPEAVLILDESGDITYANQKLAAVFDVSQKDIMTSPIERWCDNPDVLQLLLKLQGGSNARAVSDTVRFKARLSLRRSIATKTYPLFAPSNPSRTIGTLIVFKDETREALARQARTEFVAHLAHELKSPLNVLGLYSESLSSDIGKDEGFRIEAANVIANEVDRLSSLTNGLLNLTQIETGSLSPEKSLVRLRDVASASFEQVRLSKESAGMSFDFESPKEVSPVFVDKDLIRIAIDNLLSNAVKYNSKNGNVRLAISETDDAIQICVSDTGIGISDDDEERIFDKFYRSSDAKVQGIGGHGLGLALTKQIVELHQGSLFVNRDRSSGSEFVVNLWKETSSVRQAI